MGDPVSAILANGVGTSVGSFVQNERNIATQKAENERNRVFQSQENALDRDWQQQMQEQNLRSQQDFQKEMFNLQNEYNLPANQIARLRAAGINVGAAMAQGQGLVGAGSSTGFASSPPASFPGSHSVSPTSGIQTQNFVPAMFSSLAQLQEARSKTKLNEVQGNAIQSKTDSEIEANLARAQNERANARLADETAALTNIKRLLTEKYGDEEKSREIQHLINQSYQLYTQGKVNEAQVKLTEANERLTSIEADFKEDGYTQMLTNLKLLGDSYRAASEEYRSSAEEHRAGAALKTQQTQTELHLTQIQKYKENAEAWRNSYNLERAWSEAEKAMAEAKQAKILTDKQIQELEMLKTSRSYQTLTKIFDLIESASRTVKNLSPNK